MDFKKRDVVALQEYKLRNSIDDVPCICNHLYILNTEVIFMQFVRGKYQVCCSPQCQEIASYIGYTFDVIYECKDYNEALNKFLTYIFNNIRRHTWS